MVYRLFIVEDDPGIAGAVRAQAELWGLEARCAQDFRHVLEEFQTFQPHIVLLDVRLPFFDGYHWCREIRKVSQVPILFLSSASDGMNMVMAMNLGADDFLAKPFDQSVLTAKIQAMLRRSYDYAAAPPLLEHRGAALDVGAQILRFGDGSVPLTKNECRILLCLLENRGKVVSREKLMQRLWETDDFVDENTLTVNVGRLRRKLDAAGLPGFIMTKVGAGYGVGI